MVSGIIPFLYWKVGRWNIQIFYLPVITGIELMVWAIESRGSMGSLPGSGIGLKVLNSKERCAYKKKKSQE